MTREGSSPPNKEPLFDPRADEWGHWGKGEIGELTYKLARARGLISSVMCSEHAADLGDPEPDFPDASEMQAILDETAHKARIVVCPTKEPTANTLQRAPRPDADRAREVADYVRMGPGRQDIIGRVMRLLSEVRQDERCRP